MRPRFEAQSFDIIAAEVAEIHRLGAQGDAEAQGDLGWRFFSGQGGPNTCRSGAVAPRASGSWLSQRAIRPRLDVRARARCFPRPR